LIVIFRSSRTFFESSIRDLKHFAIPNTDGRRIS
jgi:hypothetical protein